MNDAFIKEALLQYGAIYTAIYWNDQNYSSGHFTYYHNPDHSSNHAVVIVGWDDDKIVPRSAFSGSLHYT